MPWFTRLSRFGDAHLVYSQAESRSCGMAAVMMCVFKVNKLQPGTRALYKEQEVYDVYSRVSGSAYDGTTDSDARMLDNALNRLDCGRWTAEYVGPDSVPQRLMRVCGSRSGFGPTIDVSPVIVLIGWQGGGGGHFVVVDTVRTLLGRSYATVCDPWDAQLRVTPIRSGNSIPYSTEQTIQWNLEGTPQHEYGSIQAGTANGWVVHKVI